MPNFHEMIFPFREHPIIETVMFSTDYKSSLIKYTGNQGYIIFRIIPRREEGWGDFWRSSGKNWPLIASSSFYIFGLKVSLFCPENHLFFSIEQKKLKKLFFFVIININSHFKSCWRYHKSMYEEREIKEQLIFVLNV